MQYKIIITRTLVSYFIYDRTWVDTNNQFHRINGPACENSLGSKYYFINGIQYYYIRYINILKGKYYEI